FFLMLFILMLAELTAACLLLLYENDISTWLEEDLTATLKKTIEKTDNSTSINFWDVTQEKMECCGVKNESDWKGKIPKSCCIRPCNPDAPTYYKTGCFEKAKVLFEDYFLTSGIVVIVLCIVE
ncbi:hypothetical protein NL108_014261, partial [Boleophthalmus pectinirostris]